MCFCCFIFSDQTTLLSVSSVSSIFTSKNPLRFRPLFFSILRELLCQISFSAFVFFFSTLCFHVQKSSQFLPFFVPYVNLLFSPPLTLSCKLLVIAEKAVFRKIWKSYAHWSSEENQAKGEENQGEDLMEMNRAAKITIDFWKKIWLICFAAGKSLSENLRRHACRNSINSFKCRFQNKFRR